MCSAPKAPKVPKPRRIAPLPPPEPTAERVATPAPVQARRRASARGGTLTNALRIPSGLNIPK